MRQDTLPLDWVKSPDKHIYIYARADLNQDVESVWFDPRFWEQNQAIVGESKGRFTTYFIEHDIPKGQTLNMVLRHYYRGGMVRHFSQDKFVYTGIERTRCFRELTMLADMRELGLPVPRPVAARVVRKGLFCSNDILIETIPDAKDGYNHLKYGSLSDEVWFEIGRVIRTFHEAGVYHSDLNIHNILINACGDVYLIDFDNCEFRPDADKWRQDNLMRLHRSLEKEKRLSQGFAFESQNWQSLLNGYGQ